MGLVARWEPMVPSGVRPGVARSPRAVSRSMTPQIALRSRVVVVAGPQRRPRRRPKRAVVVGRRCAGVPSGSRLRLQEAGLWDRGRADWRTGVDIAPRSQSTEDHSRAQTARTGPNHGVCIDIRKIRGVVGHNLRSSVCHRLEVHALHLKPKRGVLDPLRPGSIDRERRRQRRGKIERLKTQKCKTDQRGENHLVDLYHLVSHRPGSADFFQLKIAFGDLKGVHSP